jgi:hypothetical protein
LAVRGELQRLWWRCKAHIEPVSFDLERIAPPDSPLAVAASELCQRLSSPALFRHCLRTYAWGALLAQRSQLGYDVELLYVSSLLHDLGLTMHAPPTREAPCFAVSGARAARAFLLEHAVPDERALRAAECITLHMNPWVPSEHSPEAQLMAAGAALDAVGARKHEIAPATRAVVLQAHPPANFAGELVASMSALIGAWPDTRATFLCCNVGLLDRIGKNQL